jgi:hypothetical protein
MTQTAPSIRSASRTSPFLQFRIWNFAVLVAYVAIAIVDIQDQRRHETALIILASAGYAAYGLIVWTAWHGIRRLEARLGLMVAVLLYLVSMAAFYWVATNLYLVAEDAFLRGGFH